MEKRTKEERIKKLQDQIAECRDYISSDFCYQCMDMYEKIKEYEKQLNDLQKEIS